jgi:hypothetical protein
MTPNRFRSRARLTRFVFAIASIAMPSPALPRAKLPVEFQPDVERKLLQLRFRGHVAGKDMAPELDRLAPMFLQLGTGFSLVTDLTELDNMDLDCVPHVTRMMDLCLRAGVRQVVRVIPDPGKDIGFKLLSMTHYRRKVPVVTCETRAEAERAIATP